MEKAERRRHGDIPSSGHDGIVQVEGLLKMPWTKFAISPLINSSKPWSIGCPTRCCKRLAKRMASERDPITE